MKVRGHGCKKICAQRFTSFIGRLGGRGFADRPIEMSLSVTSAVER